MASTAAKADRETLTLRGRAYESFTRHLLADDIRPGQFISQRELVAITQLPLGAIRELIPRLEAEGLIKTVPQRGMQVAHVDLNLIRDAFQFRLFLEREAVALFAEQAPAAVIAELLAEHQTIIAAFEAAERAGTLPDPLMHKAQEVDQRLHTTIIEALGNGIIADAYRVNFIKIRLIRQATTRIHRAVLRPTMAEHLAILHALQARDPAAARAAMGAHILLARDRAMGLQAG